MKIWMSFDMEGVAGIVDWDQCRPSGGARYEIGCQLMLDEVNAAIEGAVAGGATDVVLNDSHGTMANLDPRRIAGGASYISGRHKPRYMMQGLDDSFDAAFLVTVLGEIPDQQQAIGELARVLRPGGRLVVGELFGDPHMVRLGKLRERAEAAALSFERRLGTPLGYFARFTAPT